MISWPQDFVPDQGQTFADACDAIQKNNIQRRHRQTNEIVYAVKHIPAHSTIAHRQHFVAGNSTGTLSVFGKSSNSGLESYFDEEPLAVIKLHRGPIYAIEWIRIDNDDDDGTLVTSSEGEIAGWKWRDVDTSLSHTEKQETVTVNLQPIFKFDEFPVDISTGGKVETNALCFDQSRGLLYSGSGDGFVHVWDLKQRTHVHRFHACHKKGSYVLSLKCTKEKLFVGGDDGIVQVFDTSSGEYRLIHSLSPFTGDVLDHTKATGHRNSTRSASKAETELSTLKHSSWVSTIDISADDNWLVCGGGAAFATLWFIPSLQIISVLPTSSTCNVALFHNDQIITAGNEKYVYFWERNGSLRARLPTGLKSIFAVDAVHAPHTQYDNIFIISGVGTNIQLLKNGQRVSTCSI